MSDIREFPIGTMNYTESVTVSANIHPGDSPIVKVEHALCNGKPLYWLSIECQHGGHKAAIFLNQPMIDALRNALDDAPVVIPDR